MNQTRPDYQSYLLRLRRADNAGWPNWWASLESAASGEHRNFADLDGLFAFLEIQTNGTASSADAQTVVALAECLQAGNAQASLHLARLLQADKGGALVPLAAEIARRLGLPEKDVHEAMTGAAWDFYPSREYVDIVPPRNGSAWGDADITKLQQAEAALRRRNRELALFNRASQAFGSTLDLDQVLVTVLEEMRRLLGVAACSVWLVEPDGDELICRQATGPHSDVVRGWRMTLGEGLVGWVARTGEGQVVSDTRADQRHFKGVDQQTGVELRSILSVPLRIKEDVIGVLQVADTATDRFGTADLMLLEPLAASAAIAIDNARLVEALRQRTVELEARNEELDAFAHTVAHDLKNPLNLVIGYTGVLKQDHAVLADEGLGEYLEVIAQSGYKMSNIIDELLLLTGARKMEVEARPLDMASTVSEALQRLTLMMEEYQAEIILPDTWPSAMGYDPWIEEVWTNYISNALKYGGHPPRVELGAAEMAGGAVRFWVRDNGPGIPPEAEARLFTPFTRLDQVRTEGHGLGLSIVRRIVEKLGGQVGVESQTGQGSTFVFILPAVQSEDCLDSSSVTRD